MMGLTYFIIDQSRKDMKESYSLSTKAFFTATHDSRQRAQLSFPDLLYTQVFKVFSEARHKLVKPNHKTKAKNAPIFRTSRLPIFHNLIEFKYLGVGFNGRETWLVEFLHCVPNLKTLTLNFPV
ncbi:Protein vdcC [Gossypium arboreum]|uniref:Protein vdcC n=1 Tax=Gossypium arboreum TaxID=29729 RepID=A0A0B0Q1T9_GOSAR|nr:Protein vdcC [Gossypium arboreum]